MLYKEDQKSKYLKSVEQNRIYYDFHESEEKHFAIKDLPYFMIALLIILLPAAAMTFMLVQIGIL